MKNISNRYSKVTREAVVSSIVNGELWLEEAITKFGIHDREIVIKWLRRHVRDSKRGRAG